MQVKIYVNGKEYLTLIDSNHNEIKCLLGVIKPLLKEDKQITAIILDHDNTKSLFLYDGGENEIKN